MKTKLLCIASIAVMISSFSSSAAPSCKLISFEDMKPAGFRLDECWNGTGMDHNQNAYIGISYRHTPSAYNDSDDVAIFRYNAKTGQRQYLNTLKGICAANGNLGPNQYWPRQESIAKIHLQFTEHNGKMYFSSHDYHNLAANYSDTIQHRGGHFFSYDIATGQFEDLSKSEPYGVSVRYQGIISMSVLRAQNKLAGYTFPWGDILIYDLATRKSTFYRAPAEYRTFGNNCGREIFTTNKGKVFFTYKGANAPFFELNTVTGVMKKTAFIPHNGFIPSLMETRDHRYVHFNSMDGYLSAFNTETEVLENLGFCIPDSLFSLGRMPTYVHFGMSYDETKLYSFVLAWKNNLGTPYDLFEYDIPTRKKRLVGNFNSVLKGSVISGSGFADSLGRLYFSRFEGGIPCGLIQITLDPSTGISHFRPGNLRVTATNPSPSSVSIVDLLGRRLWSGANTGTSSLHRFPSQAVTSSPYLLHRSGQNENGSTKVVNVRQ